MKPHPFSRLLIIWLVSILFFISCQPPSPTPTDYILENVNIIDGTGGPIQENMSIHISEGLIVSITKSDSGSELEDLKRIDLSGKYILPGLFDMHVHLATDPTSEDNLEKTIERLETYLNHGITGVRDMAGDTRQLAYLARQSSLDEITSPDLYFSSLMAGPGFFTDPRTAASAKGETPGKTSWMKGVDGATNLQLAVAEAKGTGATGIKLYADINGEISQKIIKEAHAQNIKVWAHASVIPAKPQDLAEVGINSVSHAPLLAWQVADEMAAAGTQRYDQIDLDVTDSSFQHLIYTMKENEVILDPTIKIFETRLRLYDNAVKATKAAYEAGVEMVIGTDMAIGGEDVSFFPMNDEMEALVDDVGMKPADVIKAATLNSAKLLGVEDSVGSIAVGKKANLIIVENNPLEDIRHLRNLVGVIKNGNQFR